MSFVIVGGSVAYERRNRVASTATVFDDYDQACKYPNIQRVYKLEPCFVVCI